MLIGMNPIVFLDGNSLEREISYSSQYFTNLSLELFEDLYKNRLVEILLDSYQEEVPIESDVHHHHHNCTSMTHEYSYSSLSNILSAVASPTISSSSSSSDSTPNNSNLMAYISTLKGNLDEESSSSSVSSDVILNLLMLFYTDWCGHCIAMKLFLKQLEESVSAASSTFHGFLKIGRYNTNKNSIPLQLKGSIKKIPTLVFFKSTSYFQIYDGPRNFDSMERWVKSCLMFNREEFVLSPFVGKAIQAELSFLPYAADNQKSETASSRENLEQTNNALQLV